MPKISLNFKNLYNRSGHSLNKLYFKFVFNIDLKFKNYHVNFSFNYLYKIKNLLRPKQIII